MTSEPPTGSGGEPPPQWEELLRSMFGADADDAMRELRERGMDPAAMAAAAGLPDDPQMLGQVLGQVQRMLATSGTGPVNWDVAHDVARQTAAGEGDPTVTPAEVRAATQALTVAELWLDAATDLPPAGGGARVWSRAEWVEHTLPTWRTLAEPVASSLSAALVGALADQLPKGIDGDSVADGVTAGIDPAQLMRQLGSAVFGMQVGQAAGTLSREVFGATDIGLPLIDEPATVLVPSNVAAFADGLDAPLEEVRLFLAVREAAHARLFTHVAWLRGHLLGIVQAYARGITIDVDSLEEAVRSIDPTDPAALQGALSGGVFAPHTTPEQQANLLRLETALALVEGWVDEVTAAATIAHLPHAVALREMIRRRRAAGGPAEQTFATLVGLEMRPRRSRDAAALWAEITRSGGPEARDAVWGHPDLLPTTQDLDAPAGYATRRAEAATDDAAMDRALAEILDANPDAPDAPDAGPGAAKP
ncbi:zinc-dependent metalloprotease [Pengzhenrongella sicca]|uniref:Zinc-dependent metalloprotease n=1 Tax=Pengzhenrongella sicca TaxID=2819238 RepID=A0A8A4ZDI9_9MICO|nr:zinc-dependent metalloprotease [Pengzhenrongella sicca]QTE30022.1 zinc-dependent metalloprotease [Pengzhenrongella sicca]